MVKEVELAGQFKIDIFLTLFLKQLTRFFAVFILNGNWFSLATSAFRGIISDFVRGMELRKREELKPLKQEDGEERFLRTCKRNCFQQSCYRQ